MNRGLRTTNAHVARDDTGLPSGARVGVRLRAVLVAVAASLADSRLSPRGDQDEIGYPQPGSSLHPYSRAGRRRCVRRRKLYATLRRGNRLRRHRLSLPAAPTTSLLRRVYGQRNNIGHGGSGSRTQALRAKLRSPAVPRSASNQQQWAYDFTTTIGTNGPDASVAGSFYPAAFHYGVEIGQQPHSPTQRCVVSDSYEDFAITANVADVGGVCGEFSYSANTADNAISGFSVDAYTGALVSVGPPVAAGRSPYALVSSSDKQHLYVANSGSNDISVLAVDQNSGELTTVPGSPFAAGTVEPPATTC